MFNKKADDTDFADLYNYLKKKNYPYINSALEYYKLALKGYAGYCFCRDKELIVSVISVISDCVMDVKFNKQISFAEELYEMMEINDESDKINYLSNLRVCLTSQIFTEDLKTMWDIYLLFENKLIVRAIVNYLSENKKYLDLVISYIKKARRYYVDEAAFYSAILTVIQEVINSDNPYEEVKRQLNIDKQNAGVYGDDLVQKVKKLEKKISW